jgi:hypothetical protein
MTFRATGVFLFRLVCAYALGKAGSMMNSAAMSANGGKMPYWADWAVTNPEDARHIHEATKEMNLWPLCDIIFGFMSIGDVFVIFASYVFAKAILDIIRSAWKWSFS